MPQVTHHEPGSFSWAELATSDPAGAKAFYGALFGWASVDSSMGPGPEDVYTRVQIEGADVGALYKMLPEQAAAGVTPHWLAYVTVGHAEETAKTVRALGGAVVADPFDVVGYGRMAILQDPGGAILAVWQPGTHAGAQRVHEPGTLSWCELATRDPDAAGRFYAELFGWGLRTSPGYTEFLRGETAVGGMYTLGPDAPDVSSNWMLYFQSADCDATAAKAGGEGGEVLVAPKDIPRVGRFAVLQDPQGAAFAIVTPVL
jgi:predicted enzyme related to lactoylglutathione lyase